MKYSLIFIAAVFLFSCNGEPVISEAHDSVDTAAVVKKPVEPPKPHRDSFPVDETKSSFKCTRSKTVKDVDKEIRLGNSVMHMKMDNASFSASTDIRIKSGSWYSLDKKPDGGEVVLDMTSVTALQIGQDEKIEAGNPGYLETKKYPTSTLTILHIDSIAGNSNKMQVVCKLQIKDTTGDVSFPAKIENTAGHPEIPSKLSGSFHIDGVKWGLNPKNAKVIKDDLKFDVVLITK